MLGNVRIRARYNAGVEYRVIIFCAADNFEIFTDYVSHCGTTA